MHDDSQHLEVLSSALAIFHEAAILRVRFLYPRLRAVSPELRGMCSHQLELGRCRSSG